MSEVLRAASRQRVIGALLIFAAAFQWGTFGLLTKKLYSYGYNAVELASVRTAIGLIALALLLVVRRQSVRITKREIPFFLAYGLIGFALFEWLYFKSLEFLGVGVAAALLYTAPAFVLLYGLLRGEEKWSARRLSILLLVLVGAALVTGAARAIVTGTAPISAAGLFFGLSAGLTYASYTLFSKHGVGKHDPLVNLFWVFLLSTIAFAIPAPPWAVLREPGSWPWLLILGLGPTLLAYVCYLQGLKRLSASTASMLATAEPVVAAVLGFLLLKEPMTLERVVGIACIVTGALVLSRSS